MLLQLLRNGAASTTTELAVALGLSRSTVTQRLESLLDRQLIATEAGPNGSRGRPAAINRFNPHAAIVLAAQVGLTGSRFAATDLAAEVLHERFITLDIPAGPARLLADLEATFDDLIVAAGRHKEDVAGIGIGIPSAVELQTYSRATGTATGELWDRTFFEQHLCRRYGAPVFLDLDVNLLALAERRKAPPNIEVFVCVKLGTLLDASIVVHGMAVHGVGGLAGELGHLKVSGSTVPCSCGSFGCLDAVASGHALVKQLRAAGFDVTHISEVVALALQGHPEAVLAVRQAGRHIGEVLASVVNLLNPGLIAAWGYLTEAEAPLFAGMREGLYQNALPGSSEQLQLVRTALGDLAGVRGAAMMVIDEVLEPSAVDRMLAADVWAAARPPDPSPDVAPRSRATYSRRKP